MVAGFCYLSYSTTQIIRSHIPDGIHGSPRRVRVYEMKELKAAPSYSINCNPSPLASPSELTRSNKIIAAPPSLTSSPSTQTSQCSSHTPSKDLLPSSPA